MGRGGEEGEVCMVDKGMGFGCEFFIRTGAAVGGVGMGGGDKGVGFGRVVGGMEVVRQIERTRVRGGGVGRPVADVVVVQCGEM